MQRGQALVGLSILRARDGRPLRHPGAVFGWLFPLLLEFTSCSFRLKDGQYFALGEDNDCPSAGLGSASILTPIYKEESSNGFSVAGALQKPAGNRRFPGL